jgi:hypothetical protein
MQCMSAPKMLLPLGLAMLPAGGGATAAGRLNVNIQRDNIAGAKVIVVGPSAARTTRGSSP